MGRILRGPLPAAERGRMSALEPVGFAVDPSAPLALVVEPPPGPFADAGVVGAGITIRDGAGDGHLDLRDLAAHAVEPLALLEGRPERSLEARDLALRALQGLAMDPGIANEPIAVGGRRGARSVGGLELAADPRFELRGLLRLTLAFALGGVDAPIVLRDIAQNAIDTIALLLRRAGEPFALLNRRPDRRFRLHRLPLDAFEPLALLARFALEAFVLGR